MRYPKPEINKDNKTNLYINAVPLCCTYKSMSETAFPKITANIKNTTENNTEYVKVKNFIFFSLSLTKITTKTLVKNRENNKTALSTNA